MPKLSQLNLAYEYIHNKLTRGDLEPGTKLSRRKLAEEIGVSPASVQHALGQLEKAGLVECRAQSGTYVRELTVDEYANLFDLRALVEPHAAARAAERITKAQLRILENSCRRYRDFEKQIPKSESPDESWRIHGQLVEEERIFHGTILSAAGNDLLTSTVQLLRLLSHVRHDFARDSLQGIGRVADEHSRILAALKAHDPDRARQSMLEHIQTGIGLLESRLGERARQKLVAK